MNLKEEAVRNVVLFALMLIISRAAYGELRSPQKDAKDTDRPAVMNANRDDFVPRLRLSDQEKRFSMEIKKFEERLEEFREALGKLVADGIETLRREPLGEKSFRETYERVIIMIKLMGKKRSDFFKTGETYKSLRSKCLRRYRELDKQVDIRQWQKLLEEERQARLENWPTMAGD